MADPKIKVLLVEDSPIDSRVIQEMLKGKGALQYELIAEGTLSGARDRLRKGSFDLMLLDLNLPDSSGLDTIKSLLPDAVHLAIVVITGTDEETNGLEALKIGVEDFLVKGQFNAPLLIRSAKYAVERKREKTVLRDSEERYRRLLASTTDYIYTVRVENGRAIQTTHGPGCVTITGYTPDEYSADPNLWHRMIHPDDRAQVVDMAERVVKGFPVETLEHRIYHRDGTIRWIMNAIVVKKDAAGRVVFYDGLVKDITERKRMSEALKRSHDDLEALVKDRTVELELSNQKLKMTGEDLKRASKAKSEFLANMSHELRTPLASVIGFSEVLYDEKFGALNERQKKYIQNILTSGQHLLSLINDVLDLSKVESGRMLLEASLFSVKDCLEEVLRLSVGVAFSKKINPVVEIPEDLGEINADLRKFKQVVFNLISNAIKFTPAGGKVGLRARRDDAGIEVTVWDTGIGIPSEKLETVFEAFTRLVDIYTQETEGTGLGLTLSRTMVELHGGKMWIESEGVGKGTTVKFTIPSRGV